MFVWYQIGSRGVSGGVAITYGEWETAAEEKYSAFTVAELGDMLSNKVKFPNNERASWLSMERYDGPDPHEWRVYYSNELAFQHEQNAPNEAEARAKMLIYPLENGLFSLTDGKSSLEPAD